MAFVDCINCREPISDKAKTCSHCGAPQTAPKTKPCKECGAELKSTAKKCPECETLLYGNGEPSKPSAENNTSRSSSASQQSLAMKSKGNNILVGLLFGIIFGVAGGVFLGPSLIIGETSAGNALVDEMFGMKIYIRSAPLETSSETIAILRSENFIQAVSGNKGKKFLEQLASIGKGLMDFADFQSVVNDMAAEAHKLYPNANALIFSKDLRECRVVRL